MSDLGDFLAGIPPEQPLQLALGMVTATSPLTITINGSQKTIVSPPKLGSAMFGVGERVVVLRDGPALLVLGSVSKWDGWWRPWGYLASGSPGADLSGITSTAQIMAVTFAATGSRRVRLEAQVQGNNPSAANQLVVLRIRDASNGTLWYTQTNVVSGYWNVSLAVIAAPPAGTVTYNVSVEATSAQTAYAGSTGITVFDVGPNAAPVG